VDDLLVQGVDDQQVHGYFGHFGERLSAAGATGIRAPA
jgi:hypothetical protein